MRSRGVLVLSAIIVSLVLGHHAPVGAQSASPASQATTTSTTGTLSGSDVAIACAPSMTLAPAPVPSLRIVGAQDTVPRALFGGRDLVVVNGGTREGLQLDQRYFIRRPFAFGHVPKGRLQTIHTTGWLRLVAVNDATAIAQIEQACDGIVAGDYLEPFSVPAPLSTSAAVATGTPDFSSLGRVLFGDEERRIAGAGDFVMLERGGAPFAAGARIAVYRDLQTPGVPLSEVGEGVIVAMTNGTPVLRITGTRDAIRSGDYVVPLK